MNQWLQFIAKRVAPQQLMEIRAINEPSAKRFWILPSHLSSLEAELRDLNGRGYHIFLSVNPRSHKASDESAVSELVTFHADVDSCYATKNPQREGRTIPLPSMIVHSGHGWHLYWYTTTPIQVTEENRAKLKAINRGLALAVGGDPACCDLARVLRLPGFINHKPPAAPVRIVAQNAARYTLGEMEPFAVEAPAGLPATFNLVGIPPMAGELRKRFEEVRKADKSGEMMRAWRGEIGDGSSDSRFVLVKRLKEGGKFTPEEIVGITCSRRWFKRKAKREKAQGEVRRDAMRLVGKSA